MPIPSRPALHQTSTASLPWAAPVLLDERSADWPGLKFVVASEDIRRPTEWSICGPSHTFVVHLEGRMKHFEAELDGHANSFGPALPGEVWSIPAGRRYVGHALGGLIRYGVLYLDPDALDRMAGDRTGPRDVVALAGVRDEFLHRLVEQLVELTGHHGELTKILSHTISQVVILHLFRTYGQESTVQQLRPKKGPTLNAKTVRQLRDFIIAKLAEPISIGELTALTALKPHDFLVAFRQSFGLTPWQYVIDQRLRSAQRRLLQSRADITSIALDAGFSSHSHFTSVFRKHLGCSPSEFRARIGKTG